MASKYERGQAIILIAFAIVGLIAIVALAIDGGNVFLDRRRAQNAADTAAYAAALAKIEAEKQFPVPTKDAIKIILNDAAIVRATSNGYPVSTVTAVNNPPQTGCGGSTNPYTIAAGDSLAVQELKEQYIQVIINSTVNTYFAPIVGIRTLSNCVEAIARAKPGDPISLCYGALVCALAPHDSSAIKTFGGGSLTIIQGGAYSNSDDATKSATMSSNSLLLMDSGKQLIAVGGINAPDYPYPLQLKPFGSPPLPTNSPSTYYLPDYMLPFRSSTLPAGICDKYVPVGKSVNQVYGEILDPGIYCVDGSFDQANYSVKHNALGGIDGIGGVTIIMNNNGLSWAGKLNVDLNAPTKGPSEGMLIYLPYGNKNNTVKFAGSGYLNIVGTILAPDTGSLIHYSGNYDAGTFKSQLVGWNFEFGGGAGATVNQPPIIYVYPGDARVELVK